MHDLLWRVWPLVLSGAVLATAAHAEQRLADKTFYTILTPDGPMQVEMPVPSRRAVPPVTTQAVQPAAAADQSAAQPLVADPSVDASTTAITERRSVPNATPKRAAPEAAATPMPAARSDSPFFEFGGQQYVDTAYLEQREFNLEGRKRFYSLPDGLGGTQVVERESGVRLNSLIEQVQRPQAVRLAESYRRVGASSLVDLTNQQCLSAKQLKTAKRLDDKPVDFWPRPGFEPKFEFVLAELATPLQNIHLMSYTTTSRNPSYYWPLPIFLDQRGCILEGVAGFYQSKTAATWLQQAALQGHLHVPQDARYLLLTPLVEAAELSGETLADRGQLRLTPLRVAAP